MNLFKRKVAVIGSGSWATAIVKILSDNLPSIYWWVREPEVIESVQNNGRNCMYLSSVAIDPKHVKVSNDLVKTVSKADIIIMVIPSAYLHRTISDLEPKHFENKSIISAIKGIVPERMEFITDYLINHFHVDPQQLGVISGPSHAEEIAWRKLTFLTSASLNPELAAEVADYFNCDYVRTNVSDDIFGIECSVVLKNIYALAAGIFRGMGAGDNLLALFNTNCINEMIHFISSIHPDKDRNFYTAPYLGDFLVTTYSQHSRNRAFGVMIGQGYSIRTAQLEMKMVAEGYYATRCIHEINMKYKINTPIINAVFSILYEKAMFRQEMYNLLKSMK
ncbi:MAG: NAD(P)H-dependent glycerol-3-phosphate dehydrogenase [Bacteroidales bacterium]|jgi:glycerol-3-phosphate dehydrogenase (NAD(P)+)|nr:NAD(P)-binding domain-containing protein [Bacteroidales bacterium]MDD3330175.1 NAD(P)-binding domain-containing protein [Bacteroidales bacterium]MDD3691078.1 NAD(P)-binding domain-containing protein [Bacteroidales bacterium]MDD4044475.1 NAD(P)-binding domain-containing protein [Bacteroidales bacterium]MDD4582513.1 NAD(P)-binding domain-containing protein [Bacteroidales bacterium]